MMDHVAGSVALDRAYLLRTALRLGQIPTAVEPGHQTFVEPDDPRLVHYVQEVIRPELAAIPGVQLLDAPPNNLIAAFGEGRTGSALLLLNYTVTQHYNLMRDPFRARLAKPPADRGMDEYAIFARGASQNKVHQAVMLAVLRLLAARRGVAGRLFWAVNNEGRSSHACTESIIRVLPAKPRFAVIQYGGLAISLGNRGRVDVNVHVRGASSHSSTPEDGLSAIDGAQRVIQRLGDLRWTDVHPLLGRRQAIVYKVRYEPLAPHTLPGDAYLTIDRRMLPGDDPVRATDEIRAAIGDLSPFQVAVSTGPVMWPSLVDPADRGVRALAAAHRATTGMEPRLYYGRGSFDAGGLTRHDIPAVMYGARGGDWPLGDDFVAVSEVETEAGVLVRLILDLLG